MTSKSYSSTKETTAVKMNLKEARVLDKSVQTLSLEEHYQSKLRDLDKKMVKFNYGRLKSNVNRIKSHLQPQVICQFRDLDAQGKFKAEHPMSCSSTNSTKISAARKRLKLSRYRRTQSAMPKLPSQNHQIVPKDIPREEDLEKTEEKIISCSKKIRPKTTICVSQRSVEDVTDSSDFKTLPSRPNSSALLLEKIAKAQKAHKKVVPQGSYSCHDDKIAPAGEQKKSFGLDTFEQNPYEERRKKLLHMEDEAFEGLKDRKLDFVSHVDTFIQENPSSPVKQIRPEDTEDVINSIDSMAARPGIKAQCALSESDQHALFDQLTDIRRLNAVNNADISILSSKTDEYALDFLYKMKIWRQYDSKSLSLHSAV